MPQGDNNNERVWERLSLSLDNASAGRDCFVKVAFARQDCVRTKIHFITKEQRDSADRCRLTSSRLAIGAGEMASEMDARCCLAVSVARLT